MSLDDEGLNNRADRFINIKAIEAEGIDFIDPAVVAIEINLTA